MTDYCHNHSSPMPMWRPTRCFTVVADGSYCEGINNEVAPCLAGDVIDCVMPWDGLCRVCAVDAWDSYEVLHGFNTMPTWAGTIGEANAHDPADVCEAAGFVSRALPFAEVGAAGTDALLMASWEGMRSRRVDVGDDDTAYNLWLTVNAAYAPMRRDREAMQADRRATAALLLRVANR